MTPASSTLKRTCLHALHGQLGARMTEFAGFDMPLHYAGILAEHAAVREKAGLFDTCHMGRIEIEGDRAAEGFDTLITGRVRDLPIGRCRYGLMLAPDAGVIDDLIVYRLSERKLMAVVNAGGRESDLAWIRSRLPDGVVARDLSDSLAKIDLQGPFAPAVAAALVEAPLDGLRYFRFREGRFRGRPVMLSRTGYTGEIGFELYLENALAEDFWRAAMNLGAVPVGLGARDTLRLEAGLPLYGHELSRDRNAAECGLVPPPREDDDYVGLPALRAAGEGRRRLAGLVLAGRRAARPGDTVLSTEGRPVGDVTSGSFAPSLGVAVALAYLDREIALPGKTLRVAGRVPLEARVAELPFYRGAARAPIDAFFDSKSLSKGEKP